MSQKVAPYGMWESQISIDTETSQKVSLQEIRVCKRTGRYSLGEGHPDGTVCIVDISSKLSKDVLPPGYSARSTVYEYGGGAFVVLQDGHVIFTNASDQRVYQLDVDTGDVVCIVEKPNCRYADFNGHPADATCVVCIEEDHSTPSDVQNRLVYIHTDSRLVETIVEGHDFYAPRFSPDGSTIAWVQWNHPDMPNVRHVAGGKGRSATEPLWGDDNTLFLIQEFGGYRKISKTNCTGMKQMIQMKELEEVEFGGHGFVLGSTTYVLLSEKDMIAVYTDRGENRLISIDMSTGNWEHVEMPFGSVPNSALAAVSTTSFLMSGNSSHLPEAIYLVELQPQLNVTKLRDSSQEIISPELISRPERITIPATFSGKDQGIYGFIHKPCNPLYIAPESHLPPLIIVPYGGPINHITPGLSLETQLFTSRGFAVLNLNYRGSSGHGQRYRELINGQWGVYDVEDVVTAVRYLVSLEIIDASRVGIRGSSAGGYTVLQALCAHPAVFAGAVSRYVISDLSRLDPSTHKLESRHKETLLFQPGMSEIDKETVLN